LSSYSILMKLSSKPKFLDEFADLLSMIGQGGNNRLIIGCDFNLLGDEADDNLITYLFKQLKRKKLKNLTVSYYSPYRLENTNS